MVGSADLPCALDFFLFFHAHLAELELRLLCRVGVRAAWRCFCHIVAFSAGILVLGAILVTAFEKLRVVPFSAGVLVLGARPALLHPFVCLAVFEHTLYLFRILVFCLVHLPNLFGR